MHGRDGLSRPFASLVRGSNEVGGASGGIPSWPGGMECQCSGMRHQNALQSMKGLISHFRIVPG